MKNHSKPWTNLLSLFIVLPGTLQAANTLDKAGNVASLTSQVTRMEVCRNRSGAFEIIEGLGYYQLDLQLFPDHIGNMPQTRGIVFSRWQILTAWPGARIPYR